MYYKDREISVYTVYLGRKALGERKRRALRKDCYGDHAGGPCEWSRSQQAQGTRRWVRDIRVMPCT